MEAVKAEFFYRKPLKDGETKPAFGLSEPNPDRPDHKGFIKEVFNARCTSACILALNSRHDGE